MMNVRNLLTVNAVLVFLVSLTALLAPALFLTTNGLEITPFTTAQMRAFGAVSFGYGVISWLLRGERPSSARRAFLLGAGAGYLLFAVVNLINLNALQDTATSFGWVIFGLNLLLGIAFFRLAVRERGAA